MVQRLPDPPYYVLGWGCGRCLELGGEGSYDECQTLLRELEAVFRAKCWVELEAGSHPECDKEKGYWNVRMFGQNFFVMRDRGAGMCLWGPQPPADIAGFLRVARHFRAKEHRTLFSRLVRWCGLTE